MASGAWYAAAVKSAFDKGLMQGTSDSTFAPDGLVTRAQVFQTLYNMEGKPAVSGTGAFSDVKADDWYQAAAAWAGDQGLVSGAVFQGGEVLKRAQLATIVAAYCEGKGYAAEGGMAVREAPDYASVPEADLHGVGYCFDAKIMVGDESGKLNPDGQLSRAQWAQVLANIDAFAAAQKA